MKPLTRFIRTTILGGVFFLIPIVVLIIILAKALEYANMILQALVAHISAASELGTTAATALSICCSFIANRSAAVRSISLTPGAAHVCGEQALDEVERRFVHVRVKSDGAIPNRSSVPPASFKATKLLKR